MGGSIFRLPEAGPATMPFLPRWTKANPSSLTVRLVRYLTTATKTVTSINILPFQIHTALTLSYGSLTFNARASASSSIRNILAEALTSYQGNNCLLCESFQLPPSVGWKEEELSPTDPLLGQVLCSGECRQ